MKHFYLILLATFGLVFAMTPTLAVPPEVNPVEAASEQEWVQLSFADNLELKILIAYVTQRLDVNILYDEQVGGKRITIKSPSRIPKQSLMRLLESALKMKGLVLVEDEQGRWLRIAPSQNLAAIASPQDAPGGAEDAGLNRPGQAVTRIFALQHADAMTVDNVIKPFLTKPGANAVALAQQRLLIVTDFAANMSRIARLIELADQPLGEVAMEFITVRHLSADEAAQRLNQILIAKQQARAGLGGAPGGGERLSVSSDLRTNQLILIGKPEAVADALKILHRFDVPLGLQTRVYQLQTASPQRLDRLVRELIGAEAVKRLYQSSVDQEAGLLVATATVSIHDQILHIKEKLDAPLTEQQSPVRFYKLANRAAKEVLETLEGIVQSDQDLADLTVEGAAALDSSQPQSDATRTAQSRQTPAPGTPGTPAPTFGTSGGASLDLLSPSALRTVGSGRTSISADVTTNSIIVVAEPAVQQIYEKLIHMLDQRRPQVLIEITVVTLDTTDGYSLGVELSRVDKGDSTKTLTFSSFGLSDVDADQGVVSLKPGLGFNGAIISADVATVIIRALASDSHTRVISSPKILVNDHATGTLQSIAEAPTTSINASDTVATTSFASFVSAGTNVTVTPHIAEADYLQLEYTVALSSFTGSGSGGIPPPRQTNSVESQVTIPDGHTIIVGGLNREDFSESARRIPILGELPLVEYLFSNRDHDQTQSTLFVFIRPTILRDDHFEDLKYLSGRELATAELPGDYPISEPLMID